MECTIFAWIFLLSMTVPRRTGYERSRGKSLRRDANYLFLSTVPLRPFSPTTRFERWFE